MTSARFAIPLLQIGQSQKEMTHNEGLQALENCLQPIVEGVPINGAPSATEFGQQFLVGDTPTGDFAGRSHCLATWTQAGWLFTSPREGFQVHDRSTGLSLSFDGETWVSGLVRANRIEVQGKKVVGAQVGAISAPTGGSVIDVEARGTLSAVLAALRNHGLIAN